jgi:hypothetical protein
MKSKIVSCLAILALSLFNANLFARSHDSGNEDRPGHHPGETNEIDGHETFHGHIILAPTTNAPPKARGVAELQQENEHGTVFYKVEVRAFGLPGGTNSVSAILASDASTITLGDLIMGGRQSSRADLVLPAGVAITDLAQIIVSDSASSPLLVGDINATTPGTVASFKANVKITPGPGAPNAKGRAQLNLTRNHGDHHEHFMLVASKLPANTTYQILADGVEVGTVTSNKHGSLVVRNLNADLSTIRDVSLVSASDSTEALNAHF